MSDARLFMNCRPSARSMTGAAVLLVALALAPRTGTSEVPTNHTTVITGHKAGRGVTWKLDSQSYDDLLRADQPASFGRALGDHFPSEDALLSIAFQGE